MVSSFLVHRVREVSGSDWMRNLRPTTWRSEYVVPMSEPTHEPLVLTRYLERQGGIEYRMIPKETKVFYNENECRNVSLDYSLLYVKEHVE